MCIRDRRYLFSLARLCRENGGARAVEIAAMLGVTRPSVHRMMETLKKQGFIRQSGSLLCLTQQGQSVLEQYQKEYDIFLLFFHHSLGFSLLESEDCAIAVSYTHLDVYKRQDLRGICVSGGSACSSASLDPSHVLAALGTPRNLAQGLIRVSFGEQTEQGDIDAFVAAFEEAVS